MALADRQSELRALGATVVVIGAGSSAALDAFSERVGLTGLDFVALTDEGRRAHELAGLVRSKWGTYGPRAVLRSIALYAEGHFAPRRRDDGDVDQQGGALLFIDGELVLEHRNHFVGDDLDPGDVIDVLLREHARHAGQPGC